MNMSCVYFYDEVEPLTRKAGHRNDRVGEGCPFRGKAHIHLGAYALLDESETIVFSNAIGDNPETGSAMMGGRKEKA
jgi:hypothetical protein